MHLSTVSLGSFTALDSRTRLPISKKACRPQRTLSVRWCRDAVR